MSLHKLTAGSGYDYLTRQIVAQDATGKGRIALSSYYSERGEEPGVWLGRGLSGLGGLSTGDVVTARQMKALFGSGHHPLAETRLAALLRTRPNAAAADVLAAVRLGTPFRVIDGDTGVLRSAIARRIGERNTAAGLPRDWPIPAEDKARVRTDVARELFAVEHGRAPADERELSGFIAKQTRPRTTAVAGFDLTFSPVKSVSVLWAVADLPTAAAIERAHQHAVGEALRFIEDNALFTRLGVNGVRQVDVRGLVATAFTHRDSRAGDPDLHTHVAVANKVQTLDGRWRAIDGRALYAATVSASETYNTALERSLQQGLGLRFASRAEPGPPSRLRPVREVVGVDPALNRQFSKRRADIEQQRSQLVTQFQAQHGRPPTPVETIELAQQATLQTREAKHEPRTLAEQRQAWADEARNVLGSQGAVAAMVDRCLSRPRAPEAHRSLVAQLTRPLRRTHSPAAGPQTTTREVDVNQLAARVIETVQEKRATWSRWHVYAEAQRQVRSAPEVSQMSVEAAHRLADHLTDRALSRFSVALGRDAQAPRGQPAALRRRDGASAYSVAGSALFTSSAVLAAERRLLVAAGRRDGRTVAPARVEAALATATGHRGLNLGQSALVREMAGSGARVQLAIAPAGSGKTTAMRALARAWLDDGGRVIGLAPSAAAADALRGSLDGDASLPAPAAPRTVMAATPAAGRPEPEDRVHTDTLAKLVHEVATSVSVTATTSTPATRPMPSWVGAIDHTTLVIIDEAGMADTPSLDTAVTYVLGRGGSVRLVGDDQQLAAVGAGGVLRDIEAHHGAVRLHELVRFTDTAEASASLAIRDGRPEALGFYLDNGRVHVGDEATTTDAAFAAWRADRRQGRDALMLAPTRVLVADLNRRARLDRRQEDQTGPGEDAERSVLLGDGNLASVGDVIITRSNDRRLRLSATDWVKNGDRWVVTDVANATGPSRAGQPRTGPRRTGADRRAGSGPDQVSTADVGDPAGATGETVDGGGGGHGGYVVVRHLQHGLQVRLPHDYVATATGLGYACTVHSAQGVTADTTHSVASGQESRQVLYTMLTRGRQENHVYLQVVGDGDPHSVVRPETTHPHTATDLLESVLARDDTQRSATTTRREQLDPARRLHPALEQYLDSLDLGVEAVLRETRGDDAVDDLARRADALVPGITDEPAWATLRSRLLLQALGGGDPTSVLQSAIIVGDLDEAHDAAAVLTWRIDNDLTVGTAPHSPLPWIPGVPDLVAGHPEWGGYLLERSRLVSTLAATVHQDTCDALSSGRPPSWAESAAATPSPGLARNLDRAPSDVTRAIADTAVWRAATGVDPHDQRPTGPRHHHGPAARHQRRLQTRLGANAPALEEWGHLLDHVGRRLRHDAFAPVLARRLAALARAGVPASRLLRLSAATSPLPDDHPVAALWWRISRHVEPALATTDGPAAPRGTAALPAGLVPGEPGHQPEHPEGAVTSELSALLGDDLTQRLSTSPWWPALVTQLHLGTERGWRLGDLAGAASAPTDRTFDDVCQAMVWRASVALDPVPELDDETGHTPECHEDLVAVPPARLTPGTSDETPRQPTPVARADTSAPHQPDQPDQPGGSGPAVHSHPGLVYAAALRTADRAAGPATEASSADIRRHLARAEEWDQCPSTRTRMLQINNWAAAYFGDRFPNTWAQSYLHHRLGSDLTGDPLLRPGHAPPGWTGLVTHLRARGVSDDEMIATGVATTTHDGRAIDRFRDRLVFPIQGPAPAHDILGFVGRRHPDLDHSTSVKTGPKYLNTATTPLFHKSDQLFGSHLQYPGRDEVRSGARTPEHPGPRLALKGPTPVLVEGPLDAIAVTVAGGGRFIGLAALGTAVSEDHITQLAELARAAGRDPVLALDADTAGEQAAERAFWLLARHTMEPHTPALPAGVDPSSFLHDHGAVALACRLCDATPFGEKLLSRALAHEPPDAAGALAIIAARPPETWSAGIRRLEDLSPAAAPVVRDALAGMATRWASDPQGCAHAALVPSHPPDATPNLGSGPQRSSDSRRRRDPLNRRGIEPGPSSPQPQGGFAGPTR